MMKCNRTKMEPLAHDLERVQRTCKFSNQKLDR